MKRITKKPFRKFSIITILVIVFLVFTASSSFASSLKDTASKNHWTYTPITEWINIGITQKYTYGTYLLTRTSETAYRFYKKNSWPKIEHSIDSKPVANSSAKPVVQPVEKAQAKPAEKPAEKRVAKSEAKAQAKPAVTPVEKPTEKPAAKPVAKSEAKPEVKPVEKPAVKQVEKPEAKPVEKSDAKPVEKPEAKPVAVPKSEAKSEEKPDANPVAKPKAKQGEKPVTKPAEKPAAKPVEKPAVQPNTPAAPTEAEAMMTEVLNLVNKERAKVGAPALKMHAGLRDAALIKSKDMAVNNYFDHQSPTYGSPFDLLKSRGISYSAAGENIAAGQTSAASVMNSWMNSPGHKANILKKNFTHIGIGIHKDGSFGIYHTQLFMRP